MKKLNSFSQLVVSLLTFAFVLLVNVSSNVETHDFTNVSAIVVETSLEESVYTDSSQKISAVPEVSKFSISFTNTAEAKTKLEKKWEKAVERVERRTVNRTVNKIEKRINDHVDDVIDLLNPKSSEYRKWSMKQLFNSLPYGETQVLVTGAKASTLKKIVNESSNATIVGNIYKRAANGKKGAKVGFVILKSDNWDDIYTQG